MNSLVDLGNSGEAIAAVVNHIIDKISNALAWTMTPKGVGADIVTANKSLIEEIAARDDIPVIERAVLINNYKKIVREYTNQIDVIRLASQDLKENAHPEKVEDDWIRFFFEKVKIVNEEEVKILWAKILAGEFNEPGTFSRQLLHTMSIMDSKMAKSFQKIRSSCFYVAPHIYTFIYRTDGKSIRNKDKYEELKLNYKDLRELDSVGIIQYRYPNFFSIRNNKKIICYGKKKIIFDTNKNMLLTGNVSLTDVGKQLCRICPMEYDDRVLDICMETWKHLGYKPQIQIDDGVS